MTDQIQRGQQWVKSLLQLINVSADVRSESQQNFVDGDFLESDSYWLMIDETNLMPEQIQVLIGPQGTVLDAIQYLANASLNLNQTEEQQASYTVELNGYRVRRQADLSAIAQSAAIEARGSGKEVEIKSLSSAERRQVHTFLKDFQDLETFSRGKEPHRHLVVRQIQQ